MQAECYENCKVTRTVQNIVLHKKMARYKKYSKVGRSCRFDLKIRTDGAVEFSIG